MTRFYFDHNATTPISQEVLEVFLATATDTFGNASSIHQDGQRAKHQLETARHQTANLLGCTAREVVFVSGGTEADNLAIQGAARAYTGPAKHIVTTAIEHPAVLNACSQLEREGMAVTIVRTGSNGVVDPDDVRRAMRPDTVLVSVMHVNNEIGTVQPVAEIAAIAHRAGALLHCDGVQAAGRIPVNVRDLGVDLYSLSGHKMYAPKGIGALYVRRGVALQPLLYGGRHEQDRRAGTENVSGAAALGAAAQCARRHQAGEARRIEALRDRLEAAVLQRIPHVHVNGDRARRAPNTTNLRFSGIEGEPLLISLDLKGFAVSSGAACSSGAVEPSHVLLAMGLSPEEAKSSLRFSLGRGNTIEQIDALVDAVDESVAHLRKLSPRYAYA